MQIVQETNQNSAEINNETDEHKSITYTNEKMERRPDTLKFLAASVAFQNSTVKAFKRLPYTPDPDYMLNGDNNAHCVVINESKDNITPLTKPKTRMKPRGLLERRGSNVALTISLKAGEKPNPNPSAVKSPKPLAYLQQASCELSPNSLHTKSCDTALLQQEFWEIPMNHPSEKNFNVAGHGTKNRYKSILPNQHSRVKLPVISDNDPLSSYINANYIRKYDVTDDVILDEVTPATRSNSAYIATQGPMANTIDDFWRMTWREAVTSVIMITKLRERKEKCSQYLPINVGESSTYDDITVTVDSLRQFEHFTVRKSLLIIRTGNRAV
uniref:protein-tyrosine-phosphatase n=1 Tax=Ciona savignyi TaxID=51511 RepID=H2Z9P4_CIOSA